MQGELFVLSAIGRGCILQQANFSESGSGKFSTRVSLNSISGFWVNCPSFLSARSHFGPPGCGEFWSVGKEAMAISFRLLKNTFCFPFLVLKGTYHCWTHFFPEALSNWKFLADHPLGPQPYCVDQVRGTRRGFSTQLPRRRCPI